MWGTSFEFHSYRVKSLLKTEQDYVPTTDGRKLAAQNYPRGSIESQHSESPMQVGKDAFHPRYYFGLGTELHPVQCCSGQALP